MGRFCTPNQHFWYFRYICLLNFSETAPGERHWKVCKSDSFCILRKIYYAQNGGNVSFWTIAVNAFEFSSKSVYWIFLMFYLNTGIKLGEIEVKSHYAQNGLIVQVLELWVHCYFLLVYFVIYLVIPRLKRP